MRKFTIIFFCVTFLFGCEPEEETFSFACDISLFSIAGSGTLDGEPVCFRNFSSGLGFTEGSSTLNLRLADGILLSDGESIFDLEAFFMLPKGTIELNQRYQLSSGDYGGISAVEGWIELTEDNNDPFAAPENPYLFGGRFDLLFKNQGSPVTTRIIANIRFEPR